ncbi:hypothetical protein QJS66_01325 [Kocuria rhizophila]|nr:hypothetical protein QJS66_01325 [Kocuria rhizophila]
MDPDAGLLNLRRVSVPGHHPVVPAPAAGSPNAAAERLCSILSSSTSPTCWEVSPESTAWLGDEACWPLAAWRTWGWRCARGSRHGTGRGHPGRPADPAARAAAAALADTSRRRRRGDHGGGTVRRRPGHRDGRARLAQKEYEAELPAKLLVVAMGRQAGGRSAQARTRTWCTPTSPSGAARGMRRLLRRPC